MQYLVHLAGCRAKLQVVRASLRLGESDSAAALSFKAGRWPAANAVASSRKKALCTHRP